MTKTYKHTFRNGRTITLVVDFETFPPTVLCEPRSTMASAPPEMHAEYEQWRDTVVFPDMFNNMNVSQ